MSRIFIEDKVFNGKNFADKALNKGDYELCTFSNCSFSSADLIDINFMECEFLHCDFSMAKIRNTAFKEVIFKGCKLLGLRFESCNPFLLSMNFEDCQLNLSSFFEVTLTDTHFNSCQLIEVDFTSANLSNSVFSHCELSGAIFENTNSEKVDFRTAKHFNIDPNINKIKKAKFSVEGLVGLLQKYDIEIQ